MLLTDLLTPERVVLPMSARDKAGAIAELTRVLVERSGGVYDDVLRAVSEREAAMSTGVGFGVAIPHGRSSTVAALSMVCGVSPVPVPFEAIDGEPVRLFFLLVGPDGAAGEHVRILSRIARLVRQEEVRERLTAARTADEFHHALAAIEAE